MCSYDPFYWYEKDLDDEYLKRTGGNMNGFSQAMQEYESKLFDPYGDEEFNTEWEDEDPEVDRRLEDRD